MRMSFFNFYFGHLYYNIIRRRRTNNSTQILLLIIRKDDTDILKIQFLHAAMRSDLYNCSRDREVQLIPVDNIHQRTSHCCFLKFVSLCPPGSHSKVNQCPVNEQGCLDPEVCIPMSKLCDGVPDCTDGWDEGPHCRGNRCVGTKHAARSCCGSEMRSISISNRCSLLGKLMSRWAAAGTIAMDYFPPLCGEKSLIYQSALLQGCFPKSLWE